MLCWRSWSSCYLKLTGIVSIVSTISSISTPVTTIASISSIAIIANTISSITHSVARIAICITIYFAIKVVIQAEKGMEQKLSNYSSGLFFIIITKCRMTCFWDKGKMLVLQRRQKYRRFDRVFLIQTAMQPTCLAPYHCWYHSFLMLLQQQQEQPKGETQPSLWCRCSWHCLLIVVQCLYRRLLAYHHAQSIIWQISYAYVLYCCAHAVKYHGKYKALCIAHYDIFNNTVASGKRQARKYRGYKRNWMPYLWY